MLVVVCFISVNVSFWFYYFFVLGWINYGVRGSRFFELEIFGGFVEGEMYEFYLVVF